MSLGRRCHQHTSRCEAGPVPSRVLSVERPGASPAAVVLRTRASYRYSECAAQGVGLDRVTHNTTRALLFGWPAPSDVHHSHRTRTNCRVLGNLNYPTIAVTAQRQQQRVSSKPRTTLRSRKCQGGRKYRPDSRTLGAKEIGRREVQPNDDGEQAHGPMVGPRFGSMFWPKYQTLEWFRLVLIACRQKRSGFVC